MAADLQHAFHDRPHRRAALEAALRTCCHSKLNTLLGHVKINKGEVSAPTITRVCVCSLHSHHRALCLLPT